MTVVLRFEIILRVSHEANERYEEGFCRSISSHEERRLLVQSLCSFLLLQSCTEHLKAILRLLFKFYFLLILAKNSVNLK